MKILVLNNGSTSARFQLLDMEKNILLAEGGAENINTKTSYYKYKSLDNKEIKMEMEIESYERALEIMNHFLFESSMAALNSPYDIDAIGHRVIHGGEKYSKAEFINEEVLSDVLNFARFSPIHNSNTYKIIKECFVKYKDIKNIAVFDTAFHLTIPEHNYLYAIPRELYNDHGIRKYGFHGTSYNYVLKRYAEITNKNVEDINAVICHMGGGCSMCSIKDGKSYDTTMGFTPASGLIMASRAGNIDPTIIPYIMEKENLSYDMVIKLLNEKSGYLAICNDKDAKSIVERSEMGDKDALLLRKMVNKDFKYHLLSMMSNLDRVDSIILTGGMNAKNYQQREMFLSDLKIFGIDIDTEKNKQIFNKEAKLSTDASNIDINLIPTDEELEIANQCKVLLRGGK